MDQGDFSEMVYDGIVVPACALRKQNQNDKYGHVEGLPDEELADPDELERIAIKVMWWPILRLPRQYWDCKIATNINDDGRIECDAFCSTDFETLRPKREGFGDKIEKLKDKRRDHEIMTRIIGEKIPGKHKYRILRLVLTGELDLDDIRNEDMRGFAKQFMRTYRLKQEIEQRLEKRRKRHERALEKFLNR